jgi:hypothetical protein
MVAAKAFLASGGKGFGVSWNILKTLKMKFFAVFIRGYGG